MYYFLQPILRKVANYGLLMELLEEPNESKISIVVQLAVLQIVYSLSVQWFTLKQSIVQELIYGKPEELKPPPIKLVRFLLSMGHHTLLELRIMQVFLVAPKVVNSASIKHRQKLSLDV